MLYAIITLWVLGAYGIILTQSSTANGYTAWDEHIDVVSCGLLILWPATITFILFLSIYDSATSNQWKL